MLSTGIGFSKLLLNFSWYLKRLYKYHIKSYQSFLQRCTHSQKGPYMCMTPLFSTDLCSSHITFLCCFWNEATRKKTWVQGMSMEKAEHYSGFQIQCCHPCWTCHICSFPFSPNITNISQRPSGSWHVRLLAKYKAFHDFARMQTFVST